MVILISSKHLNPHVHTTRKATELPSLTDISILTHISHTKQMPTSGSDSSTNRWGKKKNPHKDPSWGPWHQCHVSFQTEKGKTLSS